LTFDPVTGQETSSNATSLVYGSSFNILRVDVTNGSGQLFFSSPYPCPTGEVTLADNGQPLDLDTYRLNSQGYTEDLLVQLTGGSNNLAASYSGDSSYNASTTTDAITVTPAPTTITLSGLPPSVVVVFSPYLTATVSTQSYGLALAGTVQLLNNGSPIGQPAYVSGTPYVRSTGAFATGQAILTPSLSLPAGTATITAQYSGDSHYAGSTSSPTTITVTDFNVSANPTTVNISAPGQSGTSAITITPLYGFTGTVNLSVTSGCPAGATCTFSSPSVSVTGTSAVTTTLTVTTTAQGSAIPTAPRPRVPPMFGLPAKWPWLLAGLLALATMMSLATVRRRPACLLSATALLVVGIWAACGGGGVSSPPPAAPLVSLSPASLTFGQVNYGSSSAAQKVTLSNTGNASLSMSDIGIGGTNPGDFAETNNCSSSVAAGANCTINVVFSPLDTGSLSASLAVADNASDSPQTVSLAGTELPRATPPGTYSLSLQAVSGNAVHNLGVSVIVQ
jgi:hypothetical protein